jgi:hypothetical protein
MKALGRDAPVEMKALWRDAPGRDERLVGLRSARDDNALPNPKNASNLYVDAV